MMKKIIACLMLIVSLVSVFANGSVNLVWNAYTDAGASVLKIYGVPGTNTVFVPVNNTNHGNALITMILPTAATNAIVTNLASGAWTFTITAITLNGIESVDSNLVWTNVLPGVVTGLRITGTTTP